MGLRDQAGDGPASWQQDPFGRHGERWWSGTAWTEKVRTGDLRGIDPPGIHHAPEAAPGNVPANPITDAGAPVAFQPLHLPRLLLIGVILLLVIVAIIAVGIMTA